MSVYNILCCFIAISQKINHRADLAWFEEFVSSWNGRSLIPRGPPTRCIQVDACLTGIGATDGVCAYAARVAPDIEPILNITEIEAANVIIALHTFISEADAGTRVAVQCDNMATVQTLTSGRAHNLVLAECARAAWMVEALFNVKLCFFHLPGAHNQIADALSRAHTAPAYYELAAHYIKQQSLQIIYPCTYVLSFLTPSIKSRSGVQLASIPGGGATGARQGARHTESASRSGQGPGPFRLPLPDGPNSDGGSGRLPLGGAPRGSRGIARHSQEQGLEREGLHTTGGRFTAGIRPHQGVQGPRRGDATQGPRSSDEAGLSDRKATPYSGGAPFRAQRTDGEDRSASHVFWSTEAVGGCASNYGHLRPSTPSNEGRYIRHNPAHCQNKVGKELTTIRSEETGHTHAHWRPGHMPRAGCEMGPTGGGGTAAAGTTAGIPGHGTPDSHISHQGHLDSYLDQGGNGPYHIHTSQPTKGIRYSSVPRGLLRARGAEARGLVINSSPGVYQDQCRAEDLQRPQRLNSIK